MPENTHELYTVGDIQVVIKAVRVLGDHVSRKEFADPCFIDWALELPQQAHVLLRGHNVPMVFDAAPFEGDIAVKGPELLSLADEMESQAKVSHGEVGLSPALVSLLIKAILIFRTLRPYFPF